MAELVLMETPHTKQSIRAALEAQRDYTFALYADLPEAYWTPAQFPFSVLANPPIWELAHIAWFAEFFCCRWKPDDIEGLQTPSVWRESDLFLNSSRVPHRERWIRSYPSREELERYMSAALQRVLDELVVAEDADLSRFQLALLHEDMHGEALLMTLRTLGLPAPAIAPARAAMARPADTTISLGGGSFQLGSANRSYQFDNELPVLEVEVAPFEIDLAPVSARSFVAWKGGNLSAQENPDAAAVHICYEDAIDYAAHLGRRLPTEAEWEVAAVHSDAFWSSAGHVWEWTTSVFAPRPGFVAGPYHDYSVPSFPDRGGRATFRVLKGGSFATNPRLKYPQYRNFYAEDRNDMFCGFRTCKSI